MRKKRRRWPSQLPRRKTARRKGNRELSQTKTNRFVGRKQVSLPIFTWLLILQGRLGPRGRTSGIAVVLAVVSLLVQSNTCEAISPLCIWLLNCSFDFSSFSEVGTGIYITYIRVDVTHQKIYLIYTGMFFILKQWTCNDSSHSSIWSIVFKN